MLKRIGAEEGGEFKAVASGTLPSGRPVVVNADGTVSVISQTSATQALGSATVFEAATTIEPESAFDSNSNKIVIAYRDGGNSDHGTAVVGTVSGTSISFGTPVVFNAGETTKINVVFDTSNNKIVITYQNDASSDNGTAIVGTVSGTGISFGSPVEFETSDAANQAAVFDSTNNKVVVLFRDGGNSNYGTAIVGTVSGTSISFGTKVVFTSTNLQYPSIAFDSSNGKVVIAYKNDSNNYGTAIVGTVSGTSISFGSAVVFNSGATAFTSTIYDSNAQKIVIAYRDDGNSDYGTAIVGTVSGTSISFGSEVVYESANSAFHKAVYDVTAQKVVIAYQDGGNSDYGTVISGTVSGTSISFDTAAVFESATTGDICIAYDSNAEKVVIAYRDYGNSSHGTSIVFQTGYSSTNLTSENYIGMSRGVVNVTSLTQTIGSAVTFEDADTKYTVATFDSVNNKVIIAYRDNGNGGYLTAIVGTVSGTSISFGTPVVAASNSSTYLGIAFNANAGKCVISYKNASTTYGLAIVGTVSGTSISFGTAAIFNSADTENIIAGYDAASQNVVIAYQDKGNSSYGTAIVAVISGTSVSFGSEVVFQSTNSNPRSIVYDSGSSKIIIGYRKYDSWMRGFGVVGTVSGNSISFGTPVRFDTHNTSGYDIEYISLTYDSNANKTLFTYRGNSQNGQINVATVSGTSISFGTVVTFHAANTQEILSFYDPDAQLHGIAYEDAANTPDFEYVTATISGTSATISSPTAISSNIGSSQMTMGATYDTNANKGVLAYQILSPDSRGTARVIQNASTTITRGQVTNGQAASMDIIGSVSDNQIGLTIGQQYFVQTDGTIGTTAATPSVLAGTAISATELVVKT